MYPLSGECHVLPRSPEIKDRNESNESDCIHCWDSCWDKINVRCVRDMQLESSNMPGAQKTDLGIGKVFSNSNKSIY